MRLVLVEDNKRLAALIREGLEQRGFAVDWCASVEEWVEVRETAAHDLCLVDLGLPDGDGLDLVRAMRRRGDSTPVLVLTARGGLDDRVMGLDAGADDYVVKPFEIAELAARCRALLRRPQVALDTLLVAGNLSFNVADRSLRIGEGLINVSPKEAALLEQLLRRSGQPVARPMLENALYSMDKEVTPNALEAALSRLRKRLVAAGADVQIKTIHGFGYALAFPE